MYIRRYVCTYALTYVRTYVRTYVPTYVHTYVRYVRTYARTYVPTYASYVLCDRTRVEAAQTILENAQSQIQAQQTVDNKGNE